MTAFTFRAARPDGESVAGTIEAGTATAALDLVAARGLFPIELHAQDHARRTPTAAPADLSALLAGLAALLEAGLPADRALAAVQETAPARFTEPLAAAHARVREGASISAALEATGIVPPMVLALLRAGERTGRLAAAAARAAVELERTAETHAKMRAALTYPAFLAVAGTVSVTVIAGFVVPRFAQLLDANGQALPTTTRALLTASRVIATAAAPLSAVLLVLAALVVRWARTPPGGLAVHRWLLELPVIGALRLRFATARACGALAALMESAVPIIVALDLARLATGDKAMEQRFAAARDDVEHGERLWTALQRHQALSPVALRLVSYGERAGRLPAFLSHAARLEERTAQRSLQGLVALLEPMLILTFGALVAFVAAALLQAVYSIQPGTLR